MAIFILILAIIPAAVSISYKLIYNPYTQKFDYYSIPSASDNLSTGRINVTDTLIIDNFKASGCDVKAYEQNGSFYCGTDSGGGGGTFDISNLTDYFGDASFNSSVIRRGNTTWLNENEKNPTNATISINTAQVTNLSALPFSNMQTSNISNSIGQSNYSLWNSSDNIVFPRLNIMKIRIGNISLRVLANYSNDTFSIIDGSMAVYGSANATSFNATLGLFTTLKREGINVIDSDNVSWVRNNEQNPTNTTISINTAQITNLSAAPFSNMQLSNVTGTAVSRTDWTTHDNYPSGCSSGSYVNTIGDTLTCAQDQVFNGTQQDWTDTSLPLANLVLNASDANDGIFAMNGTKVLTNINLTKNISIGLPSLPTNISLYSPNGSRFECGVSNSGTFGCLSK